MSEIIKREMIIVSNFSEASQRVGFISQFMRNEEDANSIECYIASFKGENGEKSKIRIGTLGANHIWTEFTPYEKSNVTLPSQILVVNLFDLQSCLLTCRDDIATMRIIEEDGDFWLRIGCYHNDDGYDELEVKLHVRIISELPSIEPPYVSQGNIAISNFTANPIIRVGRSYDQKELLIDCDDGDLTIGFVDEKFSWRIKPTVPNGKAETGFGTFRVTIPFSYFTLMASTGSIDDIKMTVADDGSLYYYTDKEKYGFRIAKTIADRNAINVTECDTEILVAQTEFLQASMQTIASLATSSKKRYVTASKYSDTITELSLVQEGRKEISILMISACLIDDDAKINYIGVLDTINISGVDAMRIKHDGENWNSIAYQNAWSDVIFKFAFDF